MDVTIQRTDSQRSQNGHGPRVSFNRDVHVKRIGSRQSPAESHHQETPPRAATPPVRRELPKDLSEEGILAEAARVLAQAESVKCTAQGGNDIVGGRTSSKSRGPIEPIRKFPESQFNSLPLRGKKKVKTPVTRSVSDASAKKSKKPSIFSLFGRRDSGPEEAPGKRVTRSKSDVGTSRERNPVRKRNNSENDEGVNAKKKAPPLSPIIESSQKEDYFAKGHEARASKSPRGPVKLEDLNVLPAKGVSNNIKDTITNLVTTQAKSTEEMHSSQQPAEKPPLTKGLTVDGMVKRLSMERFSPPPQIAGPAFSYTRPKEQIIYAQVVCDGDKAKQTVHYAPSHLNGFHAETNGRRNGRPSHSPSPFRDLNGERLTRRETPRANSDEDEGLGFETKRPYEEDFRVDEGPITPNIRDVPPEKYYLGGDLTASGGRKPAFQELSQRREILQSRINNRRFGSREILQDISPERENLFAKTQESRYQRSKSHDIDQVDNGKKYHKFGSHEVMNRYSPERSHLDMTQTPNGKITSKYVEESRYYHDGRDGYRETYRKETNIGTDGKPRTSESRSRERLASPRRIPKEIDLGYIEDHRDFNVGHIEPNTSYFQDKYRNDLHQPRSLESTTSGDGEGFRHFKSSHLTNGYRHESVDQYQNSLRRQQKHQRSFDKGDSGIENDYRKDSFNGDLQNRWRRRTVDDDIKACETFLRKERRHTEENHPAKRRLNYAYRERSIDDGSHFDPRLDKYPDGTLRRSQAREKSPAKVEKKKSGLEKVKQLLTGSGKKKSAKEEKTKEKYMVKEEEMRARYSEYRGEGPKVQDIATRRRLSTPKASPIPRRTSSQKSTSKSSSNLSQQENSPVQKLSWFKSLDRLSRKNKTTSSRKTTSDDDFSSIRSPRPRPLSPRQENQAPQRKSLRFFGDTDQESNASVSKGIWKNKSRHPLSTALTRGQKKYSRSAYDLDTISKGTKISSASKAKSSSLQHLENDFLFNGKTKTQSRNLHDISESASDNENSPTGRHRSAPAKPQRGRQSAESTSIIKSTTLNRRTPNGVTVSSSHDEDAETEMPFQRKRHYFEEASRRHDSPARTTLRRELSFGGTGSNDYRKPPPGPQKPARLFEKRRAYSRERERLHDSSGTEGDSSQQSQRSVVYLHATTVGDIPQPLLLNRRRAASREELSSKSKGQRPMTRTVSRSVSVLAPWKPKHLHEGYEINYSQTQDKPRKFYHQERKSPGSASNLTAKRDTTTLTRYKKSLPRDEMSSDKSSSNLGFTTQPRQTRSHKRESEPRNLSEISLTRRRDTPERFPATRRRWND
ncbi:uncharacterized protein LOC132265824 [Phlebotomus argentipes]|uniref:uncharacterized protein LOC132265824 n=1 Tax=Phlebotomus argentipes TaxID=94469 RepID=UPI002893180D|nr:uncharacterized protein LOC132265824 [Phlebotomus argentipes]XP_059622590.1 uncharacterized protein LOC132265824 [Phlebotomus argentipes]